MCIDILNLQRIVRIDKKGIVRLAERSLKALGEDDKAELSLLFVDDLYIKKLNNKYRGVDSRTDVLAFPMRNTRMAANKTRITTNIHGNSCSNKVFNILGDVVVSAQTAKREARNRRIAVQKELALYVAHGILHLAGYDDRTDSQKKKMRAMEKELLAVF